MLLPFNNISIQNKNMKVRLKNMFDLTHQKQKKKKKKKRAYPKVHNISKNHEFHGELQHSLPFHSAMYKTPGLAQESGDKCWGS